MVPDPRWPVALAVLVKFLLVLSLPHHHRLLPAWIACAGVAAIWFALVGAAWGKNRPFWLRVESILVKVVACIMVVTGISILTLLIALMVTPAPEPSGIALLSSSVAAWVNNVVAFSLIYWQVDRGGPAARETNAHCPAHWRFAEENEATASPWQPRFVDYLYLAFSTSTAFSSTDTAVPINAKAKLLEMLNASISLAIMVVVASRAINVLGD